MQSQSGFAVVIMAAGKGTRMKDPSKAKVMAELNGVPLIHHVIRLANKLNAGRIIAIVGYMRETVEQYIAGNFPKCECVTQAEQLGTGHAIMQTESSLKGFSGSVLVLSGDVPLLQAATIEGLALQHEKTKAVATILTAHLEDPSGYGRIIRNDDQSVKKIVEHHDASPEELHVKEINSGIYLFQKEGLFEALKHIRPHNVQNEYYLTDVFEYFWDHGGIVSAVKAPDPNEIRGINTVEQLKEVQAELSRSS